MQVEVWREIINCPGYFISNLGRVKGRRGRVLKVFRYKESQGGYLYFRMPHMNYCRTIHRIVAEHFIPNPDNLPEVNHKFGDKNDNRAISLEWCTRQYNIDHAYSTGLKKPHSKRRIFSDSDIEKIKEYFSNGETNVSIADRFKCHQSTIAYIRHGKRICYGR